MRFNILSCLAGRESVRRAAPPLTDNNGRRLPVQRRAPDRAMSLFWCRRQARCLPAADAADVGQAPCCCPVSCEDVPHSSPLPESHCATLTSGAIKVQHGKRAMPPFSVAGTAHGDPFRACTECHGGVRTVSSLITPWDSGGLLLPVYSRPPSSRWGQRRYASAIRRVLGRKGELRSVAGLLRSDKPEAAGRR